MSEPFFKLIRWGVTRAVFLVGPYALKVPNWGRYGLFLDGMLANIQEKKWSGFSDKLCPIIFCIPGGWLNVMPRCKPFKGSIPKKWFKRFTHTNGGILPVEHKDNSFGFLNDRLVALDYGGFTGVG